MKSGCGSVFSFLYANVPCDTLSPLARDKYIKWMGVHTKIHKNEYIINCNQSFQTSLQPYIANTAPRNCYHHHLYFLLGCSSRCCSYSNCMMAERVVEACILPSIKQWVNGFIALVHCHHSQGVGKSGRGPVFSFFYANVPCDILSPLACEKYRKWMGIHTQNAKMKT